MKTIKHVVGVALFIAVASVSFNSCNKTSNCEANPIVDCICPADYTPVCGCDGLTYSNACHAQCAGVDVEYTGECGR